MRLKALAAFISVFLNALPGYRFEFPADHFNHPKFQIEWWYYTGNLHDNNGHRYGFELTFFRQALRLSHPIDSIWNPDQLYLAHLALTDIDGRSFYHTERLNRAGPGLAGIDANTHRYWNGNWQVQWTNTATSQQQLQAVCERFALKLDLTPLKPVVIHGVNGVSQKGPGVGEASHYLSFTRLAASGSLNGATVSGLAWMDHEFFTQVPDPSLAGWDWFAVQLDHNEELMLYRLRTKSGGISEYSSGTYIDEQGISHHLAASQINFNPGRMWHKYPVEWQITVPSLGLQLKETPTLDEQELSTPGGPSPSYWEGAVTYTGNLHDKATNGVGYLEMTGYSQPLRLGH